MKGKTVIWLGFMSLLPVLMAACSDRTLVHQAEEIKPTTNSPSEELEPREEPILSGPRIGDIAPDFILPDSSGKMVHLADELRENEQVVIVFYFGHLCPPCMAQLREIGRDRARYEEAGAQVVAIAVQDEGAAEESVKKSEASFPILADRDHTVAEAYGVEDDGWSTPSVFVIGQDGQIIWKQISHIEGRGCGRERVPSQTILENLR